MIPARPVSMSARAAWQDLRRLLRDTDAGALRGTPKRKMVRGKPYWFDQYRLGTRVIESYVGEDTEALRARMERRRDLRATERERERDRARHVRLLAAEGMLTPDTETGQILTALARAGAFRLGGTVVGTQAFRHYEGLLGVHLGADRAVVSDDFDIASFERLSLALAKAGDDGTNLKPVFADFDFAPVPALDRAHVWRWMQTTRRTLVEFLTPSFEEDEGLKTLPALGVSARSLHFLNFLIADAVEVPLLYRSGTLIRVPRPERYAIHKLIVAERRRDTTEAGKSRKDRAQAAFLIAFYAREDPHLIADTYREAMDKGPSCRKTIEASLARMPETLAVLTRATDA